MLAFVYFVATYSAGVLGLQTSRLSFRILLATLQVLLGYKIFVTFAQIYTLPQMLAFGPLCIIGTAHSITLLLVERWELPTIKTGKQRFDIPGGIRMLANGRYIGTPRAVGGLKQWPSDGSGWVQRCLPTGLRNNPKWAFVIERAVTVLVIVTVQKWLPELPIDRRDLHPKKSNLIRRLGDVSWREVMLRSILVPDFIAQTWLFVNCTYQTLAAVTVALEIYRPEDWPRLFGDISDAYTIRRFWSKFWHRLVYRPYGGLARMLAEKALGLKKSSQIYWPVESFLIFTISGFAHVVVTIALQYRCGLFSDLYFFWLQFLGIAFEETIRRLAGNRIPKNRWLGYVWVYVFFFWCLPKNYFPLWKWNCVPLGV
ncbi:hypothetical protein TruAng_005657 [Truncatella angustata]|nr:hypothetical protein TruAng_005657 [Truncatella angustata]